MLHSLLQFSPEKMTTRRWKVTLVLDIEEGSHPRKFIPESVAMGLEGDEDLVDYEFEEVSSEFQLLSTFAD
jgi:hypothetical protein